MSDNSGSSPACIANYERLRWAALRAGRHVPITAHPLTGGGEYRLSMDDARALCAAANVPLAALYLPNPTRWQVLAARLYGWRNRRVS